MDFNANILSQYFSALKMLEQAVDLCPDALWEDHTYKNEFWQLAFHALFYAHLYVQPQHKDFVPWSKDREAAHRFETKSAPYTKAEIYEYFQLIRQQIAQHVPAVDLTAPSGFDWLPFNKLETHFYNIRHIQQHAGELSERLGSTGQVDLKWVSQVR